MKLTPRNLARGALEVSDPAARYVYKRAARSDTPLPPMNLRARTGGRFVKRFVESGRDCARAIETGLRSQTNKSVYDFESVLDFGCGCGRTIMHWDLQRLQSLTGCDVDAECIEWLRGAFPTVPFILNRFDPPLPFPDHSFDLVYSVSIFSHLCLDDQQAWLAELGRITCSDGIALITVQGQHAIDRFPKIIGPSFSRDWNGHNLSDEGFVYLPYEEFRPGEGNTPGIISEKRDVSYGMAFMSPEFITRGWAIGWDLLAVHEGTVDNLQDVAILRKA